MDQGLIFGNKGMSRMMSDMVFILQVYEESQRDQWKLKLEIDSNLQSESSLLGYSITLSFQCVF